MGNSYVFHAPVVASELNIVNMYVIYHKNGHDMLCALIRTIIAI